MADCMLLVFRQCGNEAYKAKWLRIATGLPGLLFPCMGLFSRECKMFPKVEMNQPWLFCFLLFPVCVWARQALRAFPITYILVA